MQREINSGLMFRLLKDELDFVLFGRAKCNKCFKQKNEMSRKVTSEGGGSEKQPVGNIR